MEKINLTILYMQGCPYCRDARRALEELRAERAAYRAVSIDWIDENREADRAQRYTDYWYVPTIYLAGEKLYEASPADSYVDIKAQVQKALDRAISIL